MDFTKKAPKWDAAGAAPSADLQKNGFVAGYKPPAACFNYMFNRYTAAINELQDNVIAGNSDAVLCTWANGAGWYRIAEYKTTKDSTVQGASANGVELIIKRMYGAIDAEYHHIGLKGLYKKSEFYNILSACNAHIITKIRHVVDVTNLVAYIDVYYTGAASTNSTLFIMQNAADPSGGCWKFATPFTVDEAVADGQTIYASMVIPANCTPATDLDIEELRNGTVENANTLGGHDSAYFAKEEEIVANNTDYLVSNWIAAGWHRVAEYRVAKETAIQGANANSVELIIKRMYGTTQSEYHHIGLKGLYKKSEFYSIMDASNAHIIKKIRHIVDTTNLVAYIDVYYTGVADSNSTAFMLNNARDNGACWKLIAPTLVDEALADGQTKYAEMTLAANSTPFTTSNPPTAEQVGALPLTGGTLENEMYVNGGLGMLYANSEGTWLTNRSASGASDGRQIAVKNKTKVPDKRYAVILNDGIIEQNIFGEHNKPSGSYTGNGSATIRSIATGGIGNTLVIHSGDMVALVTPSGAIVKNNTSLSAFTSSEINFLNGVLTIASSNAILNGNGYLYYWMVL